MITMITITVSMLLFLTVYEQLHSVSALNKCTKNLVIHSYKNYNSYRHDDNYSNNYIKNYRNSYSNSYSGQNRLRTVRVFDSNTSYKNDSNFSFDQKLTIRKQLLQLAVPALIALSIDPILGLVDTVLVGQWAGANPAPLASMGSASSLLTFSFYIFNFLSTATAPLVATKRSEGKFSESKAVAGQVRSLPLLL